MEIAEQARAAVQREAVARQPAPHRDPVKQGVEPEGALRVRMIDLAITGQQMFWAAGIFVGTTE